MTSGWIAPLPRLAPVVAGAALLCGASRSAHAAQPIEVSTAACPTLHRAEIQRLLSIELGSVSRQWQESVDSEPLHVQLTCEGPRVAVAISDRLTDKRLVRDVEIDPSAPDRDRTAALLVSELFLGSWSELLRSPVPPALPALDLPPPVPAEPPPRREPARTLRGAVDLVAGARLRSLDHPVASGDLALRLELVAVRHLRVFVTGGYERGATGRSDGTVDFSLASAGLGVGWRSSRSGRLVLDVAAAGGAAYVDLSGSPSSGASAVGSSTSGAVAELGLTGGPSLIWGPARIGVELTTGWTVSPVTGHVIESATSTRSNGTRDVSLGGVWLGASLIFATAEAGL